MASVQRGERGRGRGGQGPGAGAEPQPQPPLLLPELPLLACWPSGSPHRGPLRAGQGARMVTRHRDDAG